MRWVRWPSRRLRRHPRFAARKPGSLGDHADKLCGNVARLASGLRCEAGSVESVVGSEDRSAFLWSCRCADRAWFQNRKDLRREAAGIGLCGPDIADLAFIEGRGRVESTKFFDRFQGIAALDAPNDINGDQAVELARTTCAIAHKRRPAGRGRRCEWAGRRAIPHAPRLAPTSSASSAAATRRGGVVQSGARRWQSEGKLLAGKQALEPRQQSVSNVESQALVNTIASGCSNILVGQAWLGAKNARLDYQQETPLGSPPPFHGATSGTVALPPGGGRLTRS
jgi:hypothetical protein